MARALDRGAARLDGSFENVGDVHALASQLDRPACNARDVQQIIDQARHVLGLTVDDVGRPLQFFGTWCARAKNLDGVPDRAERVSQLVGEQR